MEGSGVTITIFEHVDGNQCRLPWFPGFRKIEHGQRNCNNFDED